jgi:hypothetical protein
MTPALQHSLILSTAAVFGFLAGKVPQPVNPAPGPTPAALAAAPFAALAAATETAGTTGPSANPEHRDPSLSGYSDIQGFNTLSIEEQSARLLRISSLFEQRTEQRRFGPPIPENGIPPGLQIWLARTVADLSPDQTAALLESLAAAKPEQGGDFVRRLLAERLAAADTERALEFGKKTGDRRILAAAIECIAQQSGARAIRTAAALPEEQRVRIWESITFNNTVTPGGTFQEMAAALKESPGLLGRDRGLTRMLGMSLAATALQDPKAALDLVKTLGTELEPSANEEENNGGRRYRRGGPDTSPSAQLLQSTLSEVRSVSPEAASRLFDSLSPKEKSAWMHSEEAISRYQSKGIESAIQFAEKQSDSESARFAALGTWSALAQRDRAAAFQWIDSLPEGAFRQGVLTGVMIDTWRNSSTWGSERAAIEAGAALQNPATRMDYYQYLLQRPFGGRGTSRAETVEGLPISEPEKLQLLQRIAPIR